MNPSTLRIPTYITVASPVAAAGLAERIAREQGAHLVSGWGAALDVLDDHDPGAELIAIADRGRRAAVHGTTAARALVELRRHRATAGLAPPPGREDRAGSEPAQLAAGSVAEQLWETRDRLRHLQHRTGDILRIARGLAIAAAGSALILAGSNTVSAPVSVAVGIALVLAVVGWAAWTRHRALATRRSLNAQLAALGMDDVDHLTWLDQWTSSWDAAFAAVMASRDDGEEVEVSASARQAGRAAALLTTLQELEAAGITAANALELARGEWDGAVTRLGLEPVGMPLVQRVLDALPAAPLEPVVVVGRTIDDPEAEQLHELLQRPARRPVWVVAPGVDAWAAGGAGET